METVKSPDSIGIHFITMEETLSTDGRLLPLIRFWKF